MQLSSQGRCALQAHLPHLPGTLAGCKHATSMNQQTQQAAHAVWNQGDSRCPQTSGLCPRVLERLTWQCIGLSIRSLAVPGLSIPWGHCSENTPMKKVPNVRTKRLMSPVTYRQVWDCSKKAESKLLLPPTPSSISAWRE